MQSWFFAVRSSLSGLVAFTLTATSCLSAILSTVSFAVLISLNPGLVNTAEAQSTNSSAQTSPDNLAPVIELEVIPSGIAGQEQVFTSLVSDDRQVQDVFLYFRYSGQQSYNSIPMESIGGSSYYIATVSPQGDDTRAIEYYIQARDVSGNRTVEGFAFEPIVRTLRVASNNQTTVDSNAGSNTNASGGGDAPTPQSSGGLKLWHIALGVALLGLVAGAAGSGGGGGGGGNGQTVPLTLTIGSP